jgi:hypothetical protein
MRYRRRRRVRNERGPERVGVEASDAKTTTSEDRSEAQVDGANRKLPREARTGARRSRGMRYEGDDE